jgi:hypothetical protein
MGPLTVMRGQSMVELVEHRMETRLEKPRRASVWPWTGHETAPPPTPCMVW